MTGFELAVSNFALRETARRVIYRHISDLGLDRIQSLCKDDYSEEQIKQIAMYVWAADISVTIPLNPSKGAF